MRRSSKKEVRFRKISLQVLIDTLTHIWDSGADYVDIIGIQNDDQDIINIVVQEDYMTEEELEEFDEEQEDEDDDTPTLSDEDINNLI
jgi:uncharacterized damage-inducible protein DinB